MDDATKQALNDFLQRAIALAEQGVETLPSVFQEILAWKLFDWGTGVGYSLILLGAVIWARRYFLDLLDEDDEVPVVFLHLTLAVPFFFALTWLGVAISGIAKVFLAPNLVILDYLRSLS
jgi:hypothetical protein